MKRAIMSLLVIYMLLWAVPGDSLRYGPEPAYAEEDTLPSIEYDAKTQTIHVKGAEDYAALLFPDEVKKARVLEVQDDAFKLSAYLVILREYGLDEQRELPGMLDRTAKSLLFLRQYLRENAGAAYPSDLAELPVFFRIDRMYGYQRDEEQITLMYNEIGTHREFLYLLALMDCSAVGWEHLGYAWYVGVCIDPYNEAVIQWPITPKLPYYTQCIAGGVDPANVTAADWRTAFDACARVCFEKGLTYWGSLCESKPVTAEPDFTRMQDKEPGDTLLTAFTAASFLAWLDEAFGFEQLSLFCFGHKTFEEAFGMDFQSAYEAWSNWIIQTYPAG